MIHQAYKTCNSRSAQVCGSISFALFDGSNASRSEMPYGIMPSKWILDRNEVHVAQRTTEMEDSGFELVATTPEERSMLPLMMSLHPKYRASSHPNIEEHLTLRLCNRDYVSFGGCRKDTSDLPEVSGSTRAGSFSPMRRFSNIYGHFEKQWTLRETQDNMLPPWGW
jgi:hypothetical protein